MPDHASDTDSDSPRFWATGINAEQAATHAFGQHTVQIVDENAGGAIAYCHYANADWITAALTRSEQDTAIHHPAHDTYVRLSPEQRARLTTADSLMAVDNYGSRAAMPPHLRATLEDLLRPVCDNSTRLAALMDAITATDNEPPSDTWCRLAEQWIAQDTARSWRVTIEVQAEGNTPRDAADSAWDSISQDLPPVVKVWPVGETRDKAVEIDLAEQPADNDSGREDADEDGTGDNDTGDGDERDYDPNAPIIAQLDDTNLNLYATIRFEIETAAEWVLHWHDGATGAWTERFQFPEDALVKLAAIILSARQDRPLIDTATILTNAETFLFAQLG